MTAKTRGPMCERPEGCDGPKECAKVGECLAPPLAKNPAPVSDRSAAKSDDGLSPAAAPTPPASGAGPHAELTEGRSEGRDFVAEVRARFRLDSNIAYPSRVAANNVHRFIHEIADAYERLRILYMATCAAMHHERKGRSDLEAELEAARKLVNVWRAAATEPPDIGALVDRFLAWPLPASVHSDAVVSMPGKPHRSGTNLLTADEARQMIEYLLNSPPEEGRS